MNVRQVVIAASDLESVVGDLRAVLDLEVAYRDPGVGAFGLHNAVLPAGDTFVEVVSPVKPGTSAGRFLERRGADGGYMVMFQVDDFAEARRRVDALEVRVVWSVDLDDMVEVHLHPSDLPGAIVSLSEPRPPSAWRWGGPHWPDSAPGRVVERVIGVELEAADPASLAARWGQLIGREPVDDPGGARRLELDDSFVHFRHRERGDRDHVSGYAFRAKDPARALDAAAARGLPTSNEGGGAVKVGGTWLRLLAP